MRTITFPTKFNLTRELHKRITVLDTSLNNYLLVKTKDIRSPSYTNTETDPDSRVSVNSQSETILASLLKPYRLF